MMEEGNRAGFRCLYLDMLPWVFRGAGETGSVKNGTKLSVIWGNFAGLRKVCAALSGLGSYLVGYPGLRSYLASPWAGTCQAQPEDWADLRRTSALNL